MIRFLPLLLLLIGCAATNRTEPPSPLARIDHVIIGVADLEAGMIELERVTGVRPVVGGSHPGRGTRNALMSLGDGTYLELLAPDPAQTADSEDRRGLASLTEPTPTGWAVSAPSETGLRTTFANASIPLSQSQPGSRRKPDGSLLRWVTFGYAALDDPLAPFFIIWADPAAHPSRTSPAGCKLVGVGLGHPSDDELRAAIAPLALPATVSPAPAPRMRVSLRCAGKAILLG